MLAAWAEPTERVEIGALVTLQQLPQPRPARRHGAHRRPHQRRDGRLSRPRHRGRGGSSGTTTSTATSSGRRADGSTRWPATCHSSSSGWGRLNPAPTRDIPILIGGGGERKTLRIVAEHADIWHGFGSPETIAHKHAVLDEWCAKVGRDPAEIERSSGVSARPGRLPEDVADYAAGAQALYEVGTRLFTVGLSGPGYDPGPIRDLVAWRDAGRG